MLNTENAIKLVTFVAGLSSMYYAIKSDIREINTEKHYEIEHLQYQINEIKQNCCDDTRRKSFAIDIKQPEAVKPKNEIDEVF
jgi:hypothetical protein